MKQIISSLLCVGVLGACCCMRGSAAKSAGAETPVPAGPATTNAAKPIPAAPVAVAGAPLAAQHAADPARLVAAHADALHWLAAQQAADGSWSGSGEASANKVGLTGLALLALQSDGSTMSAGSSSQAIARGVQWLRSQQDSDSGLIGRRVGTSFTYDHAIATQALCVALKGAPSEELHRSAQQAVNFIHRLQNPYSAWRYAYPPDGDNDTSVTGWMVEALVAAKSAGLKIDESSFQGATNWINEVTDPTTARVGYDSIGSVSSRTRENMGFRADNHEAMTASGMVTRMNAGQTAAAFPILNKHAALLRTKLPEWDPADKMVDEYYWYFGSLATRRLGGKDWDAWRLAMEKALLGGQEQTGDTKGSWKPAGPWGYAGGAVFATSLNALSLSTML